MKNITIYSKTGCPFCQMAMNWFKKHKTPVSEILLNDDKKRLEFYESVGDGISTVPQIFIDNERIGGYTDLVKQEDYVKWRIGVEENLDQ